MRYTAAMLARLTASHAAYELSERLVSEAGTYSDGCGRAGSRSADPSRQFGKECTVRRSRSAHKPPTVVDWAANGAEHRHG
jgi:hypothetical protein